MATIPGSAQGCVSAADLSSAPGSAPLLLPPILAYARHPGGGRVGAQCTGVGGSTPSCLQAPWAPLWGRAGGLCPAVLPCHFCSCTTSLRGLTGSGATPVSSPSLPHREKLICPLPTTACCLHHSFRPVPELQLLILPQPNQASQIPAQLPGQDRHLLFRADEGGGAGRGRGTGQTGNTKWK